MRARYEPQRHRVTELTPSRAEREDGPIRRAPQRGALGPRRSSEMNRANDGLFDASKSFSEFLTRHHVRHTFHESSGAHTWMVWRRYLNEIAPLLFQSGQ
jgi:enterochelin esterase-like enzyme